MARRKTPPLMRAAVALSFLARRSFTLLSSHFVRFERRLAGSINWCRLPTQQWRHRPDALMAIGKRLVADFDYIDVLRNFSLENPSVSCVIGADCQVDRLGLQPVAWDFNPADDVAGRAAQNKLVGIVVVR